MALRKYGSIRFTNDEEACELDGEVGWLLNCEPHVNIRLKDIFRQIPKHSTSNIRLSCNPQTCKDLLWFMARYPLDISETDMSVMVGFAGEYDKRQDELERILLPDYKPKIVELDKPLRNYQSVAVDLLMKQKKMLCGDDVGLGKTVIGIGVMATDMKALPALVVCQTHLPSQWREQVAKFTGKLRVHVVKSRRQYSLPEADVYVMGYSKLIGWNEILTQGFFRTVIFDECQELRIEGSDKYRSAKLAAERAEYVLGLSATPVYNYGGEIYSIMNMIKPGCLGSFGEFTREWCEHYMYANKVKVKDPKALGAYLRENYLMIRRTKADVGRELPPINKIIQSVEYDEAFAERSKKDLREIAARVVSGAFTERGMAARELDSRARMLTGMAKAAGVADFVKVLLESGRKVLLAGWHREVYNIWEKEFAEYKPVFYTGAESPAAKEKAKKAFLEDETNLFIISLRSGVGLDGLQHKCSTVVFGELDWSPGVHEQVIGRVDRDGQRETVDSIFLVTDNGTDPLMVDVLGLKASQAHGILNPTGEVLEVVSDENRIKKLAQSILEKN